MGQKALNGVRSHRFIDLRPVAIRFTGVMTDPPADGWKGTRLLDELQGLLEFPFGSKIDISLDIVVCRTPRLTRRGFLFLSPGLTHHGMTAVTLLFIAEDNACFWIFRDGIFRAGLGTDGLSAVFADVHTPDEIKLSVHGLRTIRPNRQILDPVVRLDWIVFL